MKPKWSSKLFLSFFLLLSILISGYLYKDAVNSFFFQDDWFSLKISNAKSATDFLSFFIPRSDVIYYRPLGMQVPFFLLQRLFGINSLPFHLLTFLTHAANIILVYLLIRLLLRNNFIAMLCSFLYGTSTVHYISAFWSATYAFVLGPTFFFLSFILYLLSEQKKQFAYLSLSYLTFIIGLFVNELVATFIPILLIYQIYCKRINFRKLFSFFIPLIILLLVRFFIFTPPVSGSYQVNFSTEILQNLRGYLIWSFNWPEEIKAQFISLFGFNPQFIREFTSYFWIYLVSFFILLTIFYFIPLISMVVERKKSLINLSYFGIGWFLLGLLPVIFFTKHSYAYYLSISLVGLLTLSITLFWSILKKIYGKNKILSLFILDILLLTWTISSFTTLEFNSKIHWAPRRAKQSKIMVDKAKKFFKKEKLESNYIFIRPSSENKLALNDQDAYRVIYENENIITVYKYMIGKLTL